jgi:hypothetical protein
MAKTNSTPEEELLSLIQEGKDFGKLKRENKQVKFFTLSRMEKVWKIPVAVFKTIKEGLNRGKEARQENNLKTAAKVLMLIAGVLLAYLVVYFIFERPDISRIEQRSLPEKKEYTKEYTDSASKTLLSYLAMVQRRNIFSPFVIEDVQAQQMQAETEELQETVREMAADLQLVGILVSPELQVMIENKKTNETFFLQEGDSINKLKIEKIHPDRVVLSYQGQTLELM